MSRSEQKVQTRQRILDAAGREFRKGGFDGVGVDGLAGAAGVTSGAFYVHFGSKAAAFRESVVQGVSDVKAGVEHFQAEYKRDWWPEFVRFYLSAKRQCDLSESCGMQSFASEVARSDSSARAAYEAALLEVAKAIVVGPRSANAPRDLDAAHAALAMLIGGVTMARAVNDPNAADRIAAAVEHALLPKRSTPSTASPVAASKAVKRPTKAPAGTKRAG